MSPPAQDFLDAGAELLRVGHILQEGVQVVHQVGVPGADPVAVIGGQAPALARGDFGEDLPGVPLGEHLQGAALARFGIQVEVQDLVPPLGVELFQTGKGFVLAHGVHHLVRDVRYGRELRLGQFDPGMRLAECGQKVLRRIVPVGSGAGGDLKTRLTVGDPGIHQHFGVGRIDQRYVDALDVFEKIVPTETLQVIAQLLLGSHLGQQARLPPVLHEIGLGQGGELLPVGLQVFGQTGRHPGRHPRDGRFARNADKALGLELRGEKTDVDQRMARTAAVVMPSGKHEVLRIVPRVVVADVPGAASSACIGSPHRDAVAEDLGHLAPHRVLQHIAALDQVLLGRIAGISRRIARCRIPAIDGLPPPVQVDPQARSRLRVVQELPQGLHLTFGEFPVAHRSQGGEYLRVFEQLVEQFYLLGQHPARTGDRKLLVRRKTLCPGKPRGKFGHALLPGGKSVDRFGKKFHTTALVLLFSGLDHLRELLLILLPKLRIQTGVFRRTRLQIPQCDAPAQRVEIRGVDAAFGRGDRAVEFFLKAFERGSGLFFTHYISFSIIIKSRKSGVCGSFSRI